MIKCATSLKTYPANSYGKPKGGTGLGGAIPGGNLWSIGSCRILLIMVTGLFLALLGGCVTASKLPPLRTVDYVDLPRFMGDWYVIGVIPWVVEKDNVGTMDIYSQRPDGKIEIRYVFHKKSLDAPQQEWKAVARVVDGKTNADWRVQFIWPFSAPYLVIDLAGDYRYTVIGHPSRKLVWIMARQPSMEQTDYQQILERLRGQGYNTDRIVKVPQRELTTTKTVR